MSVASPVGRTSRILSVYHLFLTCEEVSFQELRQQLGTSEKTFCRDIRLLERAGVLRYRYSKADRAFYPLSIKAGGMEKEENPVRQKYLEKIRRLCILMRRMREEDPSDRMDRVALYREVLPGIPDRTRQRDFKELEALGYSAEQLRLWEGEPLRWYYEIPDTYTLNTFLRQPF